MQCPVPDRLSALAAGLAEEPESAGLLAHAAECSECAALLKETMELLSEESGQEGEEASIALLESSRPEWNRKMAARLATPVHLEPCRSKRLYWLSVAAMLLCTLAASSWWLWRLQHRPPLGQLAKAYSARRPVELRTAGAAWSEVRVERGGGGALQTPELLESEAAIARNITAHSDDSAWLHAQGLAQLLEWKFDASIQSLRLAVDLAPPGNPKSLAPIQLDLATAYFERAKAENRPIDYSMSSDLLSQALQADPSLDAALFNRAIVYENEHNYFRALDDWMQYLQQDKSGPWADEARRRMGEVQKKIEVIKPAAKNRVDDLPEQQIENALRAGLKNGAGEPLETTAARLISENGDRWLHDALAVAGNPAVAILAAMVDSRMHLEVARFADELVVLGRIRSDSLPPPLQAWLTYERIFRITHPVRSSEIGAGVDPAVRQSESHGYWFMLGQILLERASFEGIGGHWTDAEADSARARDFSARHRLASEELRAIGFLEFRLIMMGRYREAAALEHEGLERFWSRPFPWYRGRQFYSDATSIDEALTRYADASAAAATSARLAGLAGAEETEAASHARSADFAERAGMRDLAAVETARAHTIFARIPDNPGTESTRAFIESELTMITQSPDTLRPLQRAMQNAVNPMAAVPYLRTVAAFEAQSGHLSLAEERLREAVRKLDNSFNSAGPANRRQWELETDRVHRALVSVLLRENHAAEALEVWDRFLDPENSHRGRKQDGSPPLITFARLGSRYAVWIEEGHALRSMWLDGDAGDIDRLARGFAALCAAPWSSLASIQSVGNRLRRQLRGLIASRTGIFIQPDGDLSEIPWAALNVDDARIEIRPIPPGGIAQDPVSPSGKALIVAADNIAAGRSNELPALPELDREVRAVSLNLPGAALLRGPDATVANIEQALAHAGVLHFAGHTLASPSGVALLVAPDAGSADADRAAGLLQLRRSSVSRLRLAVLSACSTGRYQETENAEPASLAQQVLRAGVGEVVASLWPVDSAATSDFMTVFYRSLGKGSPTSEALRDAARSLRSRPEFARPYFWASFEVFTNE